MAKVAVAYASSDLYSMLAGVSLYSLFVNNKNIDIHTYIISTGIKRENMDKLDEVAEEFGRKIYYIDGDQVTKEISTWDLPQYHGGYEIYLRPLSPEIIQGDYDVIIFLDCDTLINGSLDGLIKRTAQLPPDKAVIMARNSENDRIRIQHGMKAESVTVNPGVIYINCGNWKASECTARFIDFFKNNDLSKYSTLDEIAYAKVLENKICVAGFNEIYYPCYRELSAKQLLFMYDLNEKHYHSKEEIESAKGNELILHYVNLLGHPWERGGGKILQWVICGENTGSRHLGAKNTRSGMSPKKRILGEK
ncbi:MAG: glycosyltransferase family 8 protein [Suilimivivens sp.]